MKNKKAIFFTLISIIFIDLFLVSFRTEIDFSETQKTNSIKARVNLMNDFIKSLELDAKRAQYISSFRSVVSLTNYVVSNGNPIDVDLTYNEIMINGTIDSNESNAPLMENQTLQIWVQRVQDLASDMDLNLTLNFSNLEISHLNAWNLQAEMDINYTLIDVKGVASFERSAHITSFFPIDGWQDPLFAIKTGGVRNIVKTNITMWNSTNLINHLTNKTYVAYADAPSFLNRLEGLVGGVPPGYGIETIIDPNTFGNLNNKSNVGYLYWKLSSPSNQNDVTGLTDTVYPDFRLDNDHCIFYNVTCT